MLKTRNTKLLDVAMAELGVAEVKGSKEHNPRIVEYHAVTTLNATADEVPWCSSFINWVVTQAGYKPTRSAMSASWRYWGKSLKKPERGCIIGYVKANGTGHVGLYIGTTGGSYKILGGNQNNRVSVANYRIADKNWFFVEPKVFLNSKTARAGGSIAILAPFAGNSEILDMIEGIKKDTKELSESVTGIATTLDSPKTKPFIEIATPYVVMALAIFVVWDRLKKERH